MFLLPVTGNDTLFVNCGELQNDEFQCSLLWQQPIANPAAYKTVSGINLACPDGNHNVNQTVSNIHKWTV